MRYIWQHIQAIIDVYTGSEPLAYFLKSYCKRFPKLGSRDRRVLSDMAYSWYRCSKGIDGGITDFEQRMKACLQLCDAQKTLHILSGSAGNESKPYDAALLFPFQPVFSEGMSRVAWLQSILVQPDLFIRLRKQKDTIIAKLEEHNIPYSSISDDCLALPNGSKIEDLLPADAYVVQDASSQQTVAFFHPQPNEHWWDCCSGAGGKSLLLKDRQPAVNLTVTDVRDSILHNLKERFKRYHLKLNEALTADVANELQLAKVLGKRQFDNIICDVPCSGSGTWARTPEQLFFFHPETHARYPIWQKNIGTNAAKYLKPGGRLIYITCSVFREENEEVVGEVIKATGLQLLSSQIINGIGIKADSMFVAVLGKGNL